MVTKSLSDAISAVEQSQTALGKLAGQTAIDVESVISLQSKMQAAADVASADEIAETAGAVSFNATLQDLIQSAQDAMIPMSGGVLAQPVVLPAPVAV